MLCAMKMSVLMLTCANQKEAGKITKSLLEKRLIVCAKSVSVSSSFLWKGKIESGDEVLILMDSIEENFAKINKEVRKLHSYKTFVLTSLAVNKTTKEVEDWIKKEFEKVY